MQNAQTTETRYSRRDDFRPIREYLYETFQRFQAEGHDREDALGAAIRCARSKFALTAQGVERARAYLGTIRG